MPALPVSHQPKVRADGRLRSEKGGAERENKKARQRGGDSVADFGHSRTSVDLRYTHTAVTPRDTYGKNPDGKL